MDDYDTSIYNNGCYDHIIKWIQSSVDILTILGFCVLTFLKLCFAFILHHEIAEMIQKIQILKAGTEGATGNTGSSHQISGSSAIHNLEDYLPRSSIQVDSINPLAGFTNTKLLSSRNLNSSICSNKSEKESLLGHRSSISRLFNGPTMGISTTTATTTSNNTNKPSQPSTTTSQKDTSITTTSTTSTIITSTNTCTIQGTTSIVTTTNPTGSMTTTTDTRKRCVV